MIQQNRTGEIECETGANSAIVGSLKIASCVQFHVHCLLLRRVAFAQLRSFGQEGVIS